MNGPIRLGMRGLDTEGGKSNQIAAISAPTPETPLLNQQFAQPPNPFPYIHLLKKITFYKQTNETNIFRMGVGRGGGGGAYLYFLNLKFLFMWRFSDFSTSVMY